MDALDGGNYAALADPFPSCDSEFKFAVHTDEFGSETAYRLIDGRRGITLWQAAGLDNNAEYTEDECLDATGCYIFQIRDFGGTG